MGARVLVVQSREAIAYATCRSLHAAGLETTLVLDGEQALHLAATDPPDAVLFDLTLPVLDGWYVLAALGARSPRPQLVAFCPPRDAERAFRLGVDACVHERTRMAPIVAKTLDGVWEPAGTSGS